MEASKSPKRKGFLALAVQANLMRYVESKLRGLSEHTRKIKAQDLLIHVVSPKEEGLSACVSLSGDYLDFHHDMSDSRLLQILFGAGANVRDDESDYSTTGIGKSRPDKKERGSDMV
ncbi:hypothetical protein BJ170DRAFT_714580 [Xylariales sp. AK1849]|nr:hypothetical protein BJ170DRAFT_714580 [Xylariales sp. AK1849]